MSNSSELFDAASLSEASYANFIGDDGSLLSTPSLLQKALTDKEWSSTQAGKFLKDWRVVARQPNTDTGFSATLFERLDEEGEGTGEYVFANRGTEPFAQLFLDLAVDLGDLVLDGLAWSQIVDMQRTGDRPRFFV